MNTSGYNWLEDSPWNQVMALTYCVGVASSLEASSHLQDRKQIYRMIKIKFFIYLNFYLKIK